MKGLIWIIVLALIIWGAFALFGGGKDPGAILDTTTTTEESEGGVSDGEIIEKSEVTFSVTGQNFSFSESELRVKEGDTVTINFEASKGFHDWVVDEFNAKTEKVNPGTPTSVTFVADKAGTYEYYCSVGGHRAAGMVGALIVE